MDVWYQCEIPYPHVPQEVLDRAPSVRASLPNRYCDPRVAADLFEDCIDEFLLADEVGLNVVAIEHHAGINSLLAANPMLVAILARQTRKARILSLGTLVTLRPDPVRIAEEYATADVISRGRLEIGFVKSGGSEVASSNVSLLDNGERYWEAIDLISKALTSHDGPFSWEGRHFTHRHVNIWPRAYQRPLPRMWSATGDASTSADVGRRGFVHALVLRGPEGTRAAFAANRRARAEAGLPFSTTERFAYAALVAVGETEEEGLRLGAKLLWFLNTSMKSAPQFGKFLPGAAPPEAAPMIYRTRARVSPGTEAQQAAGNLKPSLGNKDALTSNTAERAIAQGILLAGTPDSVYKQMMNLYDVVGGYGHLVMIGRSGPMTHAETEKSIELFAREVLPRRREIAPVQAGVNQP
jgi:alkanesulfonate monooxygenase SsuD/methylene tetrahydromethanopterin reductase-like flavin-dependent oxidoreductase (luciferase family)